MKNALLYLLVCLLPLDVSGRQKAGSGQTALVFTHVTVIDATGAPAKPDMTVVVRGDRIAALDKTGKLTVPRNAQVVDATGKFLIPGLWDMHVHPWLGKNYLALFTANGVTGIRVMSGDPEHHEWRKEISAGKLIGPRMVISSPVVDGPKPAHNSFIVVSSEDEGRQVVRKVKKEGADFVKVYHCLLRDAYFAIADEAKKQGIPFAGHVPFLVRVAEASDAGQQSIEHISFVSVACSTEGEEELTKKIKETLVTRMFSLPHMRTRVNQMANITYSEKKVAELFARFVKNDTWVCPTLILRHGLLFRDEEDLANDPRLKYMPLSTKDSWNPNNNDFFAFAIGEGRADFRKLCEKDLAIVGEMRRAGVGLLAGTDTTAMFLSPYCFPGFGLHDELVLFTQAGLSPMEALQTATYNPAKFLGKLDSMGTVEQGKIADLVLLDANPLQDINNTQKIAAVVAGGKIFHRAALQKMLAQVEAQDDYPLHSALYMKDEAKARSLIEGGADVSRRTSQGTTPLSRAVGVGFKDIIELLIAKGADVNAKDNWNWTPLHSAVYGHKDIVELLITEGANVNARDGGSRTPLFYAKDQGNNEIVELLRKHGAKE